MIRKLSETVKHTTNIKYGKLSNYFMSLRYKYFKTDFNQNVRNSVLNTKKFTISCVNCFGISGVPFQLYTKFTPFEEKLDVVFKFLAKQKKRA